MPGYWLLPSRLGGKEELVPGNTCHGKLPQAEGVGVDEKIWILYKIKIKLKAITKRFLLLPPGHDQNLGSPSFQFQLVLSLKWDCSSLGDSSYG